MFLKLSFLILATYSMMMKPPSSLTWPMCPADLLQCAPDPDQIDGIGAKIFSEEYFKGEVEEFEIDDAWDCVNLPNFRIKSALSNASTQLTFHYGLGCVGHVIEQVQGGFFNGTGDGLCAGSLFIKFNRYGSC